MKLTALAAPQTLVVPLIAALSAYVAALFLPNILQDGDVYWHLAAGEWILNHRAVPLTDPFSHTMPGAPWQAHEWLSEVFMALAYRAGGWSGLIVLTAAATALAVGLLAARLSKSLGGLSLVMTLALVMLCAQGSLLARPHMLALPILIAWFVELLAARDADRAPRLIFLPLMTLWANLHGGYVLGLALIGPFALEALIAAAPADRWKVIRTWGLFGVLALGAAVITPHGPMGLLFPFQVMGMTSLPLIEEWRAVDFSQPTLLEVILMAGLFVGVSRGMRVPPLRLLVVLLLLHMTLQHVRHQLVLLTLAPMILAPYLAEALDNRPGGTADRRTVTTWSTAALAVLLAVSTLRLALPVTRSDDEVTPRTALAHVPVEIAKRPMLNEYGWGGYLIFNGLRPYIDGRADMYGDAFTQGYAKAMAASPAAVDDALSRYKVVWTILPPDRPLTRAMDKRPGWKRIYADSVAVVHVREDVLASSETAPASPRTPGTPRRSPDPAR